MCLVIEISVPAIPHRKSGEVSLHVSLAPDMLTLFSQRQPDASRGALFRVGANRAEQCACDLMGEDFDATSVEFDLDQRQCEAFARSLDYLASLGGPTGFYLRAAYVSGPWIAPTAPAEIRLPQLLSKIRSGKLPSNANLHVRPVA